MMIMINSCIIYNDIRFWSTLSFVLHYYVKHVYNLISRVSKWFVAVIEHFWVFTWRLSSESFSGVRMVVWCILDIPHGVLVDRGPYEGLPVVMNESADTDVVHVLFESWLNLASRYRQKFGSLIAVLFLYSSLVFWVDSNTPLQVPAGAQITNKGWPHKSPAGLYSGRRSRNPPRLSAIWDAAGAWGLVPRAVPSRVMLYFLHWGDS